jgi:hypothetical protein
MVEGDLIWDHWPRTIFEQDLKSAHWVPYFLSTARERHNFMMK